VAEASADKHLACISAFECQHLMDTFAKRLPRELRNSVYQWLVPIGIYELKKSTCFETLPTIKTPGAIPRARAHDGFSFQMFHYLEDNHLTEILEHWYKWTTFTFSAGGAAKLFAEVKPLGNKVSAMDLIRNVKLNLEINGLSRSFHRRYNVPAENPNPSNGSNHIPIHVILGGFEDVFSFAPLTKIHVQFFRAPYYLGPSHADLEDLFEGMWDLITRMLERGCTIDMCDSDGTFIPDMVTPSPKTWSDCFLRVSFVSKCLTKISLK
jgi:hypothetical protein